MNATEEKRESLRLLAGLENGSLPTEDAYAIAQDLDPVLVHFIVRFLRDTYPASDPAATSVLDRVLKLTSFHPNFIERCKEGEEDSVTEWFVGEYSFQGFRGRGPELIELVVDKLDS